MQCLSRTCIAAATLVLAALVVLSAMPTRAQAQTVEQFYRNRTVRLLLAAAPGGGADIYARILVNHLGRHIPGRPTFVIINQPGAGGLLAAGILQNTAPKDGSTIGFLQRNNLLEPVLAEKDSGFDPRRVAWLGSFNRDTYVIFAWHASGIRTIQDAMSRELVLGNTGGGNENVTYPLMLNQVAGTRFKLVRGYKGSADVALAVERGEVQGRAITWTTLTADHAQWLAEKKVNVLIQLTTRPHPDLPDIPLALNLARTEQDRRLFELMLSPLEAGRPFAVPLDTPAERIAALRASFEAVAKDPSFQAELKARGGSVELMPGGAIQALVDQLYQTPKELIARARGISQAR
jgi:tripartite-type tricarboxylate transporter receptor subunit TctC